MIVNRFSVQELLDAKVWDYGYKPTEVANNLNNLKRGKPVTRQHINYWRKNPENFNIPKQLVSTEFRGKIAVIADTQCKPGESLEYLRWIGAYIHDKRPDVIVHIGDHWDFPSLSSYDKGKRSFEGRRLLDDLNAGRAGLEILTQELLKDPKYNPRLVFCMGNHEARIDRFAEENPELFGFLGTEHLPLEELGWEVHKFLDPVNIGGINFVHFLANEMTGKALGGSALNQLQKKGASYVVGHAQKLDIVVRYILGGKMQIGVVNGACYPFDEKYKGPQGNHHFRGITMLHEVHDGGALPMPVSLEYMKQRYWRKSNARV